MGPGARSGWPRHRTTARRFRSPTTPSAAARIVGFEDLGGVADLERSGRSRRSSATVAEWPTACSNIGSALGEIRRYDQRGPAARSRQSSTRPPTTSTAPRHYMLAWLSRIRFEQGRWDEADGLAPSALGDGESSPISPMVALVVRGRVRARRGRPDARPPLDAAWAHRPVASEDLQRTWPAIAGLAEAAWLRRLDRVPRSSASPTRSDASWMTRARCACRGRSASSRSGWIASDRGRSSRPAPPLPLPRRSPATTGSRPSAGMPSAARTRRPGHSPTSMTSPHLRESLDRLMRLGRGAPRGPRPSSAARARCPQRPDRPAALDRHLSIGPHAARERRSSTCSRDGLTDREIADRLVVSPRTVEPPRLVDPRQARRPPADRGDRRCGKPGRLTTPSKMG